MKLPWFILALYSLSLWSNEIAEEDLAQIDAELSIIKKGETLPVAIFENASDAFLEGYIQALIDNHYYEYNVGVAVKNHRVILYNLPINDLIANSIIAFIRDLPGVSSVESRLKMPKKEISERKAYTEAPQISGIWFPQTTVLFLPLIASPREPGYSVNYRFGDRVIGKHTIGIALGDDFPIYRWRDLWGHPGDLQIGISGGVWTVFNFSSVPCSRKCDICELVNTDYLIGIPLTYTIDKWSFRARIYHISGHLGDEFIVGRPEYTEKRRNPSFEAFDLISSYQFSSGIRMYAGPGLVINSDPGFKLKPLYLMWGTEVRIGGHKLYYHRLYGTPFFAAHMENWQQHRWHLGVSLKIGYEISKLQGVGRKMRVHLSYHQGYSYEGQFFNLPAHYTEFGFSWGF